MPWAVNAEIYPLQVRGIATGGRDGAGQRPFKHGCSMHANSRMAQRAFALQAQTRLWKRLGRPPPASPRQPPGRALRAHLLGSLPALALLSAAGIAATANWLSNAAVAQTFLTLTQKLGGSGAFYCYCAIAAGGFAWTYRFLPETNGLSLEQVQQLFGGGPGGEGGSRAGGGGGGREPKWRGSDDGGGDAERLAGQVEL